MLTNMKKKKKKKINTNFCIGTSVVWYELLKKNYSVKIKNIFSY